jgi:hypothetical protein
MDSSPLLYRFFFLYLEPISTILGAYFAHFQPSTYLQLTHATSAPGEDATLPLSTKVVLSQLANLYFLFALNEGLVLRATRDILVWRTLLFGLLVADFGHLYSVYPLGIDKYWRFWAWNIMDWGNIAFVYAGVAMRISFLLGLGLSEQRSGDTWKVKRR